MAQWHRLWLSVESPRDTVERQRQLRRRLLEEFGLTTDDPRVIAVEIQLGIALRAAGALEEAQETHAAALGLARGRFGENDPVALAAASELGLTLLASSRLHEASRALAFVHYAIAERLGPDNPRSAAAAENLALATRARGDLPKAQRLQELAVEGLTASLGELAPATLAAQASLASVLGAGGNFLGAAGKFLVVYRGMTEGLGRQHPLALAARAQALMAQRQYRAPTTWRAETEDLIRTLRERAFDDGEASLRGVLVMLLATSFELGERDEGVELAQDLVAERHRTLGLSHPQTLHALRLLARAAIGRNDKLSVRASMVAAERAGSALGRRHLDTLRAYEEYAGVLEDRGEATPADELRAENLLLRAEDEGIVGDAQPPIENLAGVLTAVEEPAEAEFPQPPVHASLPQPSPRPLERTAHARIEPEGEVRPGDEFELALFVDCAEGEEGAPGQGRLSFRPPPGLEVIELDVWLVASRHFEVEGGSLQSLELDLRKDANAPIRFRLRALHPPEAFDEEPEIRAIFSFRGWPSGQLSLPVPLVAAEETPAP